MPRQVNIPLNKTKQAIHNEANRDLRELGRARQKAELVETTPPKRVNKPAAQSIIPSSSDDSDVEEPPRAKMPRVVANENERSIEKDDDIVVVGEV